MDASLIPLCLKVLAVVFSTTVLTSVLSVWGDRE